MHGALLCACLSLGAQAVTFRELAKRSEEAKQNSLKAVTIPLNKTTDHKSFWGIPAAISDMFHKETKVLVFWAVNSDDRTKELVVKGVQQFKKSNVAFDIFLAHFDGGKDNWEKEWYSNNVRYSSNNNGYKLHLLRDAFHDRSQNLTLDEYDFVWALDNDIDISEASMDRLFKSAQKSDALIMAPSSWGGDSFWATSRPQESCHHHHTPVIEVTMPIIRKDAMKVWNECSDCLGVWGDWGPDMMWCSFVANRVDHRSSRKSCAVIDSVTVIHADFHGSGGQRFEGEKWQVHDAHSEDWLEEDARTQQAYDCVGDDGRDRDLSLMRKYDVKELPLDARPTKK